MQRVRIVGALIILGGLSGCASDLDQILPDQTVQYKKQRAAEENLEIPPDLTRGAIEDALVIPDAGGKGSKTLSEYQTERARRGGTSVSGGQVLPTVNKMTLKREGNDRSLEIEAPPAQVWPKVVAFWREQGILLVEQDPAVGVMKTDWVENRADIQRDIITRTLSKVAGGLYSAATRDQYRVRLEPAGAKGTFTDVYLSHRGMQEKLLTGVAGDQGSTFWEARPSDPGLEAEMLRRLMVYLGATEKTPVAAAAKGGEPASRSQIVRQGEITTLVIEDDFARSWRLVGVALDRVGFAVEDRDRNAGVYYVRYDDPNKAQEKEKKGFFSKLKFWGGDKVDTLTQYRVKVAAEGARTRVTVLDDQGIQDGSATATRILTLLQENLR
jgi:outer membrane protein assembly factor BamC